MKILDSYRYSHTSTINNFHTATTTTCRSKKPYVRRNSITTTIRTTKRLTVGLLVIAFATVALLSSSLVSNALAFLPKNNQHRKNMEDQTTNNSDKYYDINSLEEMNYYQILQISNDATLTDVKKAYRKLALQYHPDRNLGNEKKAEQIFRVVAEAYEVLSDETKRKEYDNMLRYGNANRYSNQQQQQQQYYQQHQHHFRDPFAQFNDLFQHDAFFKEAFAGMDDLFRETFEKSGSNNKNQQSSTNTHGGEGPGLFGNLMNYLGVNYQIHSSTFDGRTGQQMTTTTSNAFGGRTSTYTSKSTSMSIDSQGRRVTIQSMEKDGNRIEEKYIDDKLIERKINGKIDLQIMPPSSSTEF